MLYQLSYSRNIQPKSKQQITKSKIWNLKHGIWNFNCGGESRIRTYEGIRQQIYSLPQLATLVSPPQKN